jgi:hypothetical protein
MYQYEGKSVTQVEILAFLVEIVVQVRENSCYKPVYCIIRPHRVKTRSNKSINWTPKCGIINRGQI